MQGGEVPFVPGHGDPGTVTRPGTSSRSMAASAAGRNPALTRAYLADRHELVSHHCRWLDDQLVPEAEEREHIRLAFETFGRVCGIASVGWMPG